MFMFIIQILFIILVASFISEIGLKGSCILYMALYVINALTHTSTFEPVLMAALEGLVAGVVAFIVAKIILLLWEVIGSIATVIIAIIVVLALFTIIF